MGVATSQGAPLRVLIADDEPLARAKLRDMLRDEPDFEVAGECRDGVEVVRAVGELQPDLVLLDIQMPQLTGIDAVRAIGVDRMPRTVFVTAYGDFAVEAFELHALDYLLKPFDQERFGRTLGRVRAAVAAAGERPRYEAELSSFLREMGARSPHVKRFLVKRGGEYLFVRTGEIDWIQSADNYVALHCGDRRYMIRETLSGVEARLDPEQFLRVRASAIVNLERVAAIRPWSGTEFEFVLHGGAKVLSSRRFRDRIRTIIP